MTFPSDPTLRPGQLGPASSGVVQRVLDSGAARVTKINETTRQGIQELVAEGVRQGMSPAELGDVIERWSGFDEYRAELIARTELGTAYNEAAVGSYRESGVTEVHVTDGDADEECIPWHDTTVPIDEAPDALGHPNCTRDFEPVVTWTAEDYATAQDVFGTTAEFPGEAAPAPTGIGPSPALPGESATETITRIARERAEAAGVTPPVVQPAPVAKTLRDIIAPYTPKPVSTAFDAAKTKIASSPLASRDPQFATVIAKIDAALSDIGRTFRDGNLPDMPMIGPLKHVSMNTKGMYSHTTFGGTPNALEFRVGAQQPTVFHEITHFIDHHGIGMGGADDYASEFGFAKAQGTLDARLKVFRDMAQSTAANAARYPTLSGAVDQAAETAAALERASATADLMEPVAQAIMQSDNWAALQAARASGQVTMFYESAPGIGSIERTVTLKAKNREWVRYAMRPKEVFARAMAQYMARRSDAKAMAAIYERVYGERVMVNTFGEKIVQPLADQWTDTDFAPIDHEITRMLDKLGWLVGS